jgi:hypothetical protein
LTGLKSDKAALESDLKRTRKLKEQLELKNKELISKNEKLRGKKRELSIGMATECGCANYAKNK